MPSEDFIMKIKLNLLSARRRETIEESKKMRLILHWGAGIFVILVIFFVLLININYILKTEFSSTVNSYEKNSLNEKYAEIERYDLEIKQINSRVLDIENIQNGQIYWSNLLVKLNGILNSDIILSNLSNKNFVVFLVGKAKTRDSLVSLKANLEKEVCFTDVKLPLSNLVSKDDVAFQIEFNIKEECVKKK